MIRYCCLYAQEMDTEMDIEDQDVEYEGGGSQSDVEVFQLHAVFASAGVGGAWLTGCLYRTVCTAVLLVVLFECPLYVQAQDVQQDTYQYLFMMKHLCPTVKQCASETFLLPLARCSA